MRVPRSIVNAVAVLALNAHPATSGASSDALTVSVVVAPSCRITVRAASAATDNRGRGANMSLKCVGGGERSARADQAIADAVVVQHGRNFEIAADAREVVLNF